MSQRCFLAITPDPRTLLAVDAWRQRCWQGLQRPAPLQNYHLTLAFLGNIDARRRAELEQQMPSVQGTGCAVVLDDAGYWPAAGIVWLGCRESNPALHQLAASCQRVANRVGIRVESKRFTPHLTLARAQTEPPPPPLMPPDFRFEAAELVLYESLRDRSGARYRAVHSVWI